MEYLLTSSDPHSHKREMAQLNAENIRKIHHLILFS